MSPSNDCMQQQQPGTVTHSHISKSINVTRSRRGNPNYWGGLCATLHSFSPHIFVHSWFSISK